MKLTQIAAAMALTTVSASTLAATYSVTPLPMSDISSNNFGQSIDESGYMLTISSSEFNPPIDFEFLEDTGFFTSYATSFESYSDVIQGLFSDYDYSIIVSTLLSLSATASNAYAYQHLAVYRSYIADTTDADLVPGLDEWSDDFDDYAHEAVTYARDSVDGDFIVGTTEGQYYPLDYEDDDGNELTYVLNDIEESAFVSVNGETKLLRAEDEDARDTLNGLSQAFAINYNLQVAGNSAVDFIDSIDTAIENCKDDDTRGDVPIEYCYRNIQVDGSSDGTSYGFDMPEVGDSSTPGAYVRATIWQLDGSGDVVSTDTYPLVFDPDSSDSSAYWSLATDINDNGVAVGASSTDQLVYITYATGASYALENVAVSYSNGETNAILPDDDDNLLSEALAINNENWVTGYVLRAPNGTARNRIFIYNLDSGEAIYPEGFFTNAGAQGKAINNNNIVVGISEYDSTVDTNRETHGFMYDLNDGEIVDLNDLLPCDSDYTIVDAVDINDNNEIIANARYRTDSTYVNGEPIIGSDGSTTTVDTIVAVKLTPTSGSVETCELDDDEEDDEAYERQGASMSYTWLLFLGMVAFFRRRI
ncbi:DUF3466 family protein [Alteromonas sp. C1M14]|uniref:DUF3466 family protein n=1 Tax=Alteromonas sp. C1M14 TaxID=2841567 RepID=UPI001C08EBF2|nr:DUF3466 family protein [Alteromonas sp. C1M14]MBU2976888.1 DUF3466 family protein [Alteromonas sp. C1M14]